MLFRVFQYFGILLIVAFCSISILISTQERDIKSLGLNSSYYSYASFFEDRFFDLRMKMTMNSTKKDNRLVLAAIDDNSLNKIGRWPWSRTKHAELVDRLRDYGAKIIAFDVFYSEPELACNMVSPDKILSESFKKFQAIPGNKIILPYAIEKKDPGPINEDVYFKTAPDVLLNFIMESHQAPGANLTESLIAKKVFPIEEFISSEVSISHIEAESDSDGVFRHYPLVSYVDSLYLPSFALQAYELYTGDRAKLEVSDLDHAVLSVKNGKSFVNNSGEVKVRWFGDDKNFPIVSVYEIFKRPKNDPELTKIFKDKIVFIASTAYGAHDLRNTPINSMLPGIYFHMNMTHMLLEGKFFVDETESAKFSWILMTVGTLIIIGVMFLSNAILDFVVVNIIILTFLYIDTFIFIPKGYNIRLFFSILSVILCYSWSTFLHFYQSNKEKKKIKGTFSRYLAPSIVNDLLKNPEKLKLGGEKKNITVFFSDVRDFTSISEKLTPEQLTQCLNVYMTMMTDTLFEHKGTLDKYIGDAMVAYWGAPVELENHAYWAVKGAIQMIERLPPINEQFKKEGFPTFKHGIGLNTGDCSVGNMGSNQIFSYTALGDNMNLGARLESLCKFYGVQLNISEYTKNAIPAELQKEFKFRTLDKVKVKGKENAVTIYEVLHPTHHLYNDDETLKTYEECFAHYLKQEFNQAVSKLTILHDKYPEDKTFDRMLHICQDFADVPPPPGWDGTYTHKSK